MNKISKKIVSLVTMAAFALTLVPAAAFAAPEPSDDPVSVQNSDIEVTVNDNVVTDETTIDAGDSVAVKFILRDGTNQTTSAFQDVRLWAVDSEGNITDALVDESGEWSKSGVKGMTNTYYGNVGNDDVYNFSFIRGGKYTIYVSEATFDNGSQPENVTDLNNLVKLGSAKVTVEDPAVVADRLSFWDAAGTQLQPVGDNDSVVLLDFTNSKVLNGFSINGVDSYTVSGYAYQEDGSRAAGVDLDLSASRGSDVINLTKSKITTDANGAFNITFKMNKAENANIYVSGDDVNYTIRVVAEDTTPFTIETIKDGGYVLAGNSDWWYTGAEVFSDAVQFEIKTKDGDVLDSQEAIEDEPAAYAGDDNPAAGPYHVNAFAITDHPTKSDIDVEDLVLAYENGVYTLKYVGNDAKNDLVPGEYVVDLALASGDHTTATFNVADFSTIEDVQISMKAKNNYGTDKTEYTITDKVTLGQDVDADAWYVDANGIRVPAKAAQFGIDGKAVYQSFIDPADGTFRTVDNTAANESLLGSQIVVTVFDAQAKQLAQTTLTVVDAYNTYSVEFDPTQGPANEENNVNVSVVDEDGNAARVTGDISYYIADQSNEDANIDISVDKKVTNGKGVLTLYSDKETTADIVVAVKASNGAIYASTLEYTFGAEDVNAQNTVVMTIGSTDYVVNNNIVSGEAAPYIDSAWRTMVPFRVLGETFGAKVNWNEDDQTVTYTYGDTEIVMTIGEDTFTVNGEEQNMDTAPVIQNSRTMVPVRFVAEALGYTVTPLYDGETGTTASVVFQK